MTATPWPGSALRVTRVIRFNAFDMNCVAHQSPGLWRHPHDQSWRYKDLTYWTELAKLLERGRFHGLFIADVLGSPAVELSLNLSVVLRPCVLRLSG